MRERYFHSILVTTTATYRGEVEIQNRNATNSQVGANASLGSGGWSTTTAAIATSAIDTTAASEIEISAEVSAGGESMTLESYSVEVLPN